MAWAHAAEAGFTSTERIAGQLLERANYALHDELQSRQGRP
jgi:hypothetical protein